MNQGNARAVSVLRLLISLCPFVFVSAHGTDSSDIAAAHPANPDHSRAAASRSSLDLTVPPLWRVMSHSQLLAAMGTTSGDEIEVVAKPELIPMSTDAQTPSGIVDSLHWSAGHPTQAWRILLPAADAP